MASAHTLLFAQLCKKSDVIIVTGQKEQQIVNQVPVDQIDHYYMMSQQGNHVVDKKGSILWHEKVTPEQEATVRPFARKLTEAFAALKQIDIPDYSDIFENRGSQIASSVLGFHAPNELKYTADPDQSIRRSLLAQHPEEIEKLRTVGIEVMPAGTTTFDFILLGKHKGSNIRTLINHIDWKEDDCLYFGDALFPGGNDETVIGVIPTHAVRNPDETFKYIEEHLL